MKGRRGRKEGEVKGWMREERERGGEVMGWGEESWK